MRHKILLLCAMLLPAATFASDWRSINEEAKVFYVQGQYDKSAVKSREAIQAAEMTLGKDAAELIPMMNNLGRTYRLLGQLDNAVAIQQRSVQLTEKKNGALHPALAQGLTVLAQAQMDLHRYKEAEASFARALVIREKAFTLGPHHPETAQNRIDLAKAQLELGNYAGAEAGFKRAIATLEPTLGIKHPGVLEAKMGIAKLFKAQKKTPQAESALQDVLTALQKSGAAPDQTDAVLNEIVNLQLAQGHYDRAQSGLNTLAENQARRQAPYAERVATFESLISIGKLQNKPEIIESALKGLLALNEKAKGARSNETLETLDRLVANLQAQGKNEATHYAKQAEKLRKPAKPGKR